MQMTSGSRAISSSWARWIASQYMMFAMLFDP
jgi:hypothetical protein